MRLALEPSTQRAYCTQLGKFIQHSRLHDTFFDVSAGTLDCCLADYLQHLHNIHAPLAYASGAVNATVHWRPELAGKLPRAHACLRGLARHRARLGETESYPPLTWPLTALIACTLALSGHRAAGVAVLLAFDCYLRAGELTSLRLCDVARPGDPRLGGVSHTVTLRLARTKTGVNQSVMVRRAEVAAIVEDFTETCYQTGCCEWSGRLFGLTTQRFRELFRAAVAALQLPAAYTPHSLRHGGATHDFMQHRSVNEIMYRGRWTSMESCNRYTRSLDGRLLALEVPEHLHHLALNLLRDLRAVFRGLCERAPAIPTRLAPHVRRRPRPPAAGPRPSGAVRSTSAPPGSGAAGSRSGGWHARRQPQSPG
jgi:hypothetical protein